MKKLKGVINFKEDVVMTKQQQNQQQKQKQQKQKHEQLLGANITDTELAQEFGNIQQIRLKRIKKVELIV